MNRSVVTLCANIFDKLSNSADLDTGCLETIIQEVDTKLSEAKECLEKEEECGNNISTNAGDKGSENCHVEALALNCFLTNVVQALERNPGMEHYILLEFLHFCSENGMELPPLNVTTEELNCSVASLNMVADENEETTVVLWDTIRRRIRAGMLNNLEKMPHIDRSKLMLPINRDTIQKRIHFIELLLTIFPASHVYNMYQNLRKNQADRFIDGSRKKLSVSWADKTETNQMSLEEELKTQVEFFIDMLLEDLFVLSRIKEENEGIDETEFIHIVYFDILVNQVQKIVEAVECEMKHTADNQSDSNISIQKRHNKTAIRAVKNASNVVLKYASAELTCRVFSILVSWENTVELILAEQNLGRSIDKGLSSLLSSSVVQDETILNENHDSLSSLVWSEDQGQPSGNTQAEQKWPWRDVFCKLISSLSRSISTYLMETVNKYCFEMEGRASPWVMMKVTDDLYFVGLGCPRTICRSMAAFTSIVETFLPFARACGGAVFQPVQSVFVDSLVNCINQYYSHISEVISSFPDMTTISNLYAALGSLNFLSARIPYYEEEIGAIKRKPLSHVLKLLEELAISTKKIIIAYHTKMLLSSILHDSQSHNWEDPKEFFEGERVSFSLQMWNFYIRSVWNDLCDTVSPDDATEIVSSLLNECLHILLARYSRARPSFRRMSQYRADVLYIATAYASFSWRLSTTNQQFFFPKSGHGSKISNWHSMCSLLLAYMSVITAPLGTVTERFLKDKSTALEYEIPFTRMWISQCLPNLFSRCCRRFQDLEDKQAVFVIFKLLLSRPVPEWPLLIQVMTMRNAFMSILLANSEDDLVEVEQTWSTVDPTLVVLKHFGERVSQVSLPLQKERFLRQLFVVLNSSSNSGAAAHFLMSLANRENNWRLFETSTEPQLLSSSKLPDWLQLIQEYLMPTLARILEIPLFMLCEKDRAKLSPSFTFTAMTTLPCGCNAANANKGPLYQGDAGLLYACLKETLDLLVSNLGLIPRCINRFFRKLGDYLSQRHFGETGTSPGLKTIAFLLYNWITDESNIKSVINFPISSITFRTIKSFAELLWHTLHNLSVDVAQLPSISMDIHSYLKSNSSWLLQRLEMLKEGFSIKDSNQLDDVDKSPDQVTEPHYQSMCARILRIPGGKEALHNLYNILKYNQNVIENKLLGSQTKMPFHTLEGTFTSTSQSSRFNPLLEYRKCGDYVLNQTALLEQEMDWEQMMNFKFDWEPIIIGKIIMTRCEFLEENSSSLTADEKRAVERWISWQISAGTDSDSLTTTQDTV